MLQHLLRPSHDGGDVAGGDSPSVASIAVSIMESVNPLIPYPKSERLRISVAFSAPPDRSARAARAVRNRAWVTWKIRSLCQSVSSPSNAMVVILPGIALDAVLIDRRHIAWQRRVQLHEVAIGIPQVCRANSPFGMIDDLG